MTVPSLEKNMTLSNVVQAVKNQVSCDLAGEAAILDLKVGMYYGLNSTGAEIWKLLQEPTRIQKIHQFLLENYEVDKKECENDLLDLLETLQARGLIEIQSRENP
jgi:hypothetical protein